MPGTDLPTPTTDVPPLAPRSATIHKGQAGHVAIIAGSRGMSGAAILSALGALRGGAGLTRVYCARSIQPVIATSEPCLMTVPLDEDEEGRLAVRPDDKRLDLDWAHALAIGPGSETMVPMAVAVIGGVVVSTMLTLFVVPCVYSLFARRERNVSK